MMSPYSFHQFWLNVEDVKVGEMLRIFTFLDRERIEELEEETRERPHLRAAQKTLADEVTTFVHGSEQTEQAKAAAVALFGGGDLRKLEPAVLGAAMREAGTVELARGELGTVTDLLVATGLAKSRSEARRTVGEGGAYVNNDRVDDPEWTPQTSDLMAGEWLVLRRGKRRMAGIRVS